MTVEQHTKPVLKDERVEDVSPGLTFQVDTVSGPRDIFLHTPNVAQIIPDSKSYPYSMFYVRDGINHELRRGFLRGRDWYTWRQDSPEEDEKWAPYEEELLSHPLVGHEMMAQIGSEFAGIRGNLKKKGYRIERYMKDGKIFFRTVDYKPTKVEVVGGIRGNVVGGNFTEEDRLLTVKILEGKYRNQDLKLKPKDLHVPLDPKDAEARDIIQIAQRSGSISEPQRAQLQDMGFDYNWINLVLIYGLLSNGDYDRSREVSQDDVHQIINHANSSGVDHASANFHLDPRHDSNHHTETSIGWDTGSGPLHTDYGISSSGGNDSGGSYGGNDSGGSSDSGGGFGGGDSGGGGGDAGGGF